MSEWQFKWAKTKLKELGDSLIDEEAIYRAWDQIAETIETAQKQTKLVRRQRARIKSNNRSKALFSPETKRTPKSPEIVDNTSNEEFSFDPNDIEFW